MTTNRKIRDFQAETAKLIERKWEINPNSKRRSQFRRDLGFSDLELEAREINGANLKAFNSELIMCFPSNPLKMLKLFITPPFHQYFFLFST